MRSSNIQPLFWQVRRTLWAVGTIAAVGTFPIYATMRGAEAFAAFALYSYPARVSDLGVPATAPQVEAKKIR